MAFFSYFSQKNRIWSFKQIVCLQEISKPIFLKNKKNKKKKKKSSEGKYEYFVISQNWNSDITTAK